MMWRKSNIDHSSHPREAASADNGGSPVKVVAIQETNLEECVKDSQREGVVLTQRGKPVAMMVSVAGLDLDQIELGRSDDFWAVIEERRQQKTVSRAELEKRLPEPKTKRGATR
jgi:antitoxin (DNA-binding transcriptional repressor) of toxin-antitoxin stability system